MNNETMTSTQAQHTPGPWSYQRYFQGGADLEQIRSLGLEPTRRLTNDGQAFVMAASKRVALVDCQVSFKRGKGYQTDCAEREANARLIAAAPELLVALRRLLNDSMYKDHPEASQMAIVAIAKAEGRS